jgi:endoglucanase Acf2
MQINKCNTTQNRIKNKNHIINTIDIRKAFDKIQHPLIIKSPEQTRNRRNTSHHNKAYTDKPIANIILNGRKTESISSKVKNETWDYFLSLSLSLSLFLCLSLSLSHTHTHIMVYYSGIKKNEIMSLLGKWIELEIIILSEISQRERKYHIFSLIYRIWTLKKVNDMSVKCENCLGMRISKGGYERSTL